MKRLIFSTIIISGLSLSAFAQGVSLGVKAGVNFASQSYTAPGVTISPDGLTGFHGGLYVKAMFTPKIGVQPELLYSMVGAQSGSGSSQVTDKFSYLSIPILLRVNIIPAFNIHVGPQLGILLSAKETQGSATNDFKDQVNTADFGLAFGAGFDLPVGFNGGVRYALGLSDIQKNGTSGTSVKNNVVQIYIGMKLFGK